jgi:tetratricopeptide (TPR) repeat protein
MIGLALFFMGWVQCDRHPPVETRIGLFADPSGPDPDLSWALVRHASAVITHHHSPKVLAYPPTWLWDAIDPDSARLRSYLLDYGSRIDLDVVVQTRHSADSLNWTMVGLKHPDRIQPGGVALDSNGLLDASGELIDAVHGFMDLAPLKDEVSIPPVGVARQRARAERALVERRFEPAVDAARTAFRNDTTSVQSRSLLARSLLQTSVEKQRLGKPSDPEQLNALRLCEGTILRFDSTHAESYRLMGYYYLLQEMWGKAEDHFHTAIEIDPLNPDSYANLAHLHRSRLKPFGFPNKEAALRFSLRINPCNEKVRLYLANTLYFQNYKAHAERAAKKLLDIHPRSVDGLLFLGKLAVAEGNLEQVIDIYNRVLEIDPDNPVAFYNLGVYYYNAGDVDNAEALFERAVRFGRHPDSYLYLGYIHESRGDTARAIEAYRHRIRLNRGEDDLYADRARNRLFTLTKPDTSNWRIKLKLAE